MARERLREQEESGQAAGQEAGQTLSLRDWRLQRGMTQAQLAQAAGIGLTSVRELEHERRPPKYPTMLRLADALEVHFSRVRWPNVAAPTRRTAALPAAAKAAPSRPRARRRRQ